MRATRKQLETLRSLRARKGRDETGLFLVEGARLCAELTEAQVPVEFALVAEGAETSAPVHEAAEELRRAGVTVLDAPAWDFERVSDTINSQGILVAARWSDKPVESLTWPARCVVVALDAVADPGNVGTVVRTASWFGADAVLLGEGCADLLNPKTVRATMGGLFHIPVCRDLFLEQALPALKAQGFEIVAATLDGATDWQHWAAPQRVALLLGSEAHGVHPEHLPLADRRITLPRRGKGDSLNVAVSAGIFLSDIATR